MTCLIRLAWLGSLQVAGLPHAARAEAAPPPASGVRSTGPDLVVAELQGIQRWGTDGDITAYSFETSVCNVGNAPAAWVLSSNAHPIIPQHLYRLKDGCFEQIGLSWVVHTYHPFNGTFCSSDCVSGGALALGVGCSDTHSAGVNGLQSNMAPRWQVNAATGVFPYPWNSPPYPPVIGRRLQVHHADLDPTGNPGALYFVEAQYLTADESAAGNDDNNASYRRVQVVWDPAFPTVYELALVPGAETQREQPALLAWKDVDPAVTVVPTDIPSDGRMLLAYKVTEAQAGWYHYEYAVYNMNSDRSAQAFSVPIPAGVAVANTAFHDVDDHSNSPISSADWAVTWADGQLSWTTTAYEFNPYANALRWGTTYNFRFDANVPPGIADASIAPFRPGTPDQVTVPVHGPVPLTGADCNANGIDDALDLFRGTSPDCNRTGVPDECELVFGSSLDCEGSGTPDECEGVLPDAEPELTLDVGLSPEACVQAGEPVVVTLTMNRLPAAARGYQAFLAFDPAALTFASAVYHLPDPFGMPLLTPINAHGGELDVAAGINDLSGQPPARCPADLVTVQFVAGGTPGLTHVRFRPHDPPTRFSDVQGNAILPVLTDSASFFVAARPQDCADCNTNGIADVLDIATGRSRDCQTNGVPDDCDIGAGTSLDCNTNGTPDECETDCLGDPELRLGLSSPAERCVLIGEPVTLTLSMSCLPEAVRGYQAFLGFDPAALTFVSGTYRLPDPFGMPILYPLVAHGGEIDAAAGVNDLAGQTPVRCPADLVSLQFSGGSTEGFTQVHFRPHDPPTRLSDAHGNSLWPQLQDAPSILVSRHAPDCADCNTNGFADVFDISSGTSLDCNATRVPDACEAIGAGDFDADGDVNLADFSAFIGCLAGPGVSPNAPIPACVGACLAAFDFEPDGDVDFADFAALQVFLGGP